MSVFAVARDFRGDRECAMPEARGRTRVGAVVGAVCLATAVPQSGWCASAESPDALTTRPKIGLVLSGGGAKGGAQVGVL